MNLKLFLKYYIKYIIAILIFLILTITGIIVVDYNYNSFMGNSEKKFLIKHLTGF